MMSQKNVPLIKYNQKKNDHGYNDINKRWWASEKDKIHEAVWPLVTYIRQSQGVRHSSNHRFYRMYSNQAIDNLSSANQFNNLSSFFGVSARLTFNIVKSCIDTVRSKIGETKPRPLFITENGTWDLQQRAKKTSTFIQALFDEIGNPNGLVRESLYTIGSETFLDAAMTGTGCAKMYIKDGNKIVAENFKSDEYVVDQFEGINRNPRSAHQIKYIDREVLFDTYKTKKDRAAIIEAQAARTGLGGAHTQDMIPVIESIHLPSGTNSGDGLRSVCIETGTLKSAEWDKPYFPTLIQRWGLRPVGYFGMGLAEELQGIQKELNQTLQNIQAGIRRVAVPRVWRHISDHNTSKRLTNEIGEQYYYRQQKPIFETAVAFNAETYHHVDRLFNKGYEVTGISKLSSMAEKPAGLDSGKAIRNYQNVESERFLTVQNMYENFFTPQATYMVLDMLDELLKNGTDVIVQMNDGMTFEPVKYSDVQLPKGSYTVRAYPTNFLPSDPAGKYERVVEMVKDGMFDKDEAMDLLDFPDLKKAQRVSLAVRNSSISYVEKMIESGVRKTLEPFMNMDMIADLAQSYYLDGRSNGMPEDKLDLLRQTMSEVKAIKDQIEKERMQAEAQAMAEAQAAAAPPTAPPPMGGPEAPMAPQPPMPPDPMMMDPMINQAGGM